MTTRPMLAATALPGWKDYLAGFAPIGDLVLSTVINAADAQVQQETWKGLFEQIAQGVIAHVYADPDYPEFVSIANSALNILAPNPDFMYTWTPIDSSGIYRLRGLRNTARFVELGLLAGFYTMPNNAGTVGTIDLDSITLGSDTSFDFIVSKERPGGYLGDWFELPPTATNILVRSAAYDWVRERDPIICIERLDRSPLRPRLTAAELSRRLSELPSWAQRAATRHHGRIAELESKGLHNRLQVYDYTSWGGAQSQIYLEGLYKIANDEAVILETEVPDSGRYWGFMVTDDQLGTIDWMNRQSSLNAFQATLDADKKFRAVISVGDPGVPNWLDTGGYNYGMIWGRWNSCSSNPTPTLQKVKLADIRNYLPEETPVVSIEARDLRLRQRRLGAQSRRRW